MKKFISIAAGLLLAVQCFATGSVPLNTPQAGVLNFTTNGASPLVITNSFAPGFSYPPVMQFFLTSGPTNALPLTNTIITATNFAVSLATPTNCTVAWNAFLGYPRIQVGTNAITAGTPITNTFTVAYAYPPTLNIEGSTTNGIGITGITTTGFILTSAQTQAVGWSAFGISATPGPSTVTY